MNEEQLKVHAMRLLNEHLELALYMKFKEEDLANGSPFLAEATDSDLEAIFELLASAKAKFYWESK